MQIPPSFETRAHPEIHLWLIAEIEPELMAAVCPKANPGKELWKIELWPEIEQVPKSWGFKYGVGEWCQLDGHKEHGIIMEWLSVMSA